jgi:hypothetical protein
MSNSDVTDLIIALRTGAMSLDEVAARFRVRSWSRTRSPRAGSYRELAAAAQVDPGANVPGSIDDLTAAYDRGEITRAQYRALAHAVAEAINADTRRAPADGPAGRPPDLG